MTFNVVIFMNSVNNRRQLNEELKKIPHPGVDKRDMCAINVLGKNFYKVHFFGENEDYILVTRIEELSGVDDYLDYINLNKAVR